MENRPVMALTSRSPAPVADSEVFQRYLKWQLEVYHPMILKASRMTGVDDYHLVGRNRQYPERVTTIHYENLEDWRAAGQNPETAAITQEQRSWTERGITDFIWSTVYALKKSFRSEQLPPGSKRNTMIEKASIIHLEAYRFMPEEQEKFTRWLNEYGYPVFMPLLMKLPGLKGYDQFEHTCLQRPGREYFRDTEYPKNLSITYFENLNAFEHFEDSQELAGFHKVIRSVIPGRLKYEWYIQYRLVQSLRK
jgi:heme-degrading monooxygenase HmoA